MATHQADSRAAVAPLHQADRVQDPDRAPEQPPLVSVVIACVNGLPYIVSCLEHLANQDADIPYEAVVVDACGQDVRDEIRRRFPGPEVQLVGVPQRLSIPRLRGIGMARARGRMIAILEDHCNVAPGWLRAVERAHENGWQAIGGAVENGSTDRVIDWAVFFCEYARFMLPLDKGVAPEITGNNSVYAREALEQLGAEIDDEVWEGFMHRRLKELGVPFHCDPELVVSHKKAFGFLYFLSQRYHYSRSFAGMRVAGAPTTKRVLYALATGVLPPVLWGRIARTVWAKRRERLRLVKAAPLIFVFTFAWAWGEFVGSLAGPGDSLLHVE
jgi:glycosyltransferase involved in cell wall biosynthesis